MKYIYFFYDCKSKKIFIVDLELLKIHYQLIKNIFSSEASTESRNLLM